MQPEGSRRLASGPTRPNPWENRAISGFELAAPRILRNQRRWHHSEPESPLLGPPRLTQTRNGHRIWIYPLELQCRMPSFALPARTTQRHDLGYIGFVG